MLLANTYLLTYLPFPPFQITNGIVLELFKFKELCKYSLCGDFKKWFSFFCHNVDDDKLDKACIV